jgi:hypothetical protein
MDEMIRIGQGLVYGLGGYVIAFGLLCVWVAGAWQIYKRFGQIGALIYLLVTAAISVELWPA